jgi:uncharacterized protein YdhG (YjbR/CyaY superfamily)
MNSKAAKFSNIDEYIALFPADVQKKLQELRAVIKNAAPGVVETISYQIPTFDLNGHHLIHFGAWKKHIALYPTSSGTRVFERELEGYKAEKGTIQFPMDKPLPLEMIGRIVKFRWMRKKREVKGLQRKNNTWTLTCQADFFRTTSLL